MSCKRLRTTTFRRKSCTSPVECDRPLPLTPKSAGPASRIRKNFAHLNLRKRNSRGRVEAASHVLHVSLYQHVRYIKSCSRDRRGPTAAPATRAPGVTRGSPTSAGLPSPSPYVPRGYDMPPARDFAVLNARLHSARVPFASTGHFSGRALLLSPFPAIAYANRAGRRRKRRAAHNKEAQSPESPPIFWADVPVRFVTSTTVYHTHAADANRPSDVPEVVTFAHFVSLPRPKISL